MLLIPLPQYPCLSTAAPVPLHSTPDSVLWPRAVLPSYLRAHARTLQIEAASERLKVVEFLGRIFAHADDTWHKYRSLFVALLDRSAKVRALVRCIHLRAEAPRGPIGAQPGTGTGVASQDCEAKIRCASVHAAGEVFKHSAVAAELVLDALTESLLDGDESVRSAH